MATLELKTLKCVRQHDVSGSDEPKININDGFVWNAVMKKGDVRTVGVTRGFEGTATVTLEEVSNGKAKQIGEEATIRESGNPSSVVFKTSGTHYELFFEVS
jgi:hypothetical protein